MTTVTSTESLKTGSERKESGSADSTGSAVKGKPVTAASKIQEDEEEPDVFVDVIEKPKDWDRNVRADGSRSGHRSKEKESGSTRRREDGRHRHRRDDYYDDDRRYDHRRDRSRSRSRDHDRRRDRRDYDDYQNEDRDRRRDRSSDRRRDRDRSRDREGERYHSRDRYRDRDRDRDRDSHGDGSRRRGDRYNQEDNHQSRRRNEDGGQMRDHDRDREKGANFGETKTENSLPPKEELGDNPRDLNKMNSEDPPLMNENRNEVEKIDEGTTGADVRNIDLGDQLKEDEDGRQTRDGVLDEESLSGACGQYGDAVERNDSTEPAPRFRNSLSDEGNAREMMRSDSKRSLERNGDPGKTQLIQELNELKLRLATLESKSALLSQHKVCSSIMACGTPPAPRHYASSIAFGDKMIVYGGCNDKMGFGDLWEYNCSQQRWQELRASGQSPGPLSGHSAVCHAGHMFIFGGKQQSTYSNKIAQLDILSNAWKSVVPTGRPPQPRCGHAAALYLDMMFIFGGFDGQAARNDLCAFNISAQSWIPVQIMGNPPAPRRYCISTVYKGPLSTSLLIFGGTDDRRYFNDLHSFDCSTYTWCKIEIMGIAPTPRCSHSMVMIGNGILIFGGWDSVSQRPEFGLYRPDLRTWNLFSNCIGEAPSARSGHCAVAMEEKGLVLLFGGWDGTSDKNDVFTIV